MIGPEDAVATPKEMSIDEINGAVPRNVYLSADGQTPFFIVLIVLLFGLVWLGAASYLAIKDKHKSEALGQGGRETVATITRVLGGHTTDVCYSFRSGGSVYEGRSKIPEGLYFRARVGDQLRLLFLPSDPSINHPSGWAWWTWWDLLPYGFGLWIFGIGVAGLVYVYRRRRLARIGWVTEGKVIACAPKRTQFRVDYQFTTEDGQLFDGANEYSYDEYKYGDKIRVIYMRSNPKRSDTYPLADFPTVGS